MPAPRPVALRVNGFPTSNARVRRGKGGLELVITDPKVGEFAADGSLVLELLELVNPPALREKLPNRGWRKVSLRIVIALLRSHVVIVHPTGAEIL